MSIPSQITRLASRSRIRSIAKGTAALAVTLSALQGTSLGNDVDTSFEFPQSTENFTLGTSPNSVTFDGAASEFLGLGGGLHNTGFYSWAIFPGDVATATFETPAETISLFARLENNQGQGSVQMVDINGNVVLDVVPSGDGFLQFTNPSGAAPIAQVIVVNTGTAGVLAVDDVTYCAVEDLTLGTEYCGPGNPNSSGLPATISAVGSNMVSANNVTLRAEQMPTNVFGFFLTSPTQGFVANPGGSEGNLCLSGSIGRFSGPGQILNTGSTGSFELKIDLNQQPTPSGFTTVLAGDTWNFQAWSRDSVGGVSTSNLTNGLEINFL